MCRGPSKPIGGTGVYIPPFMLNDDANETDWPSVQDEHTGRPGNSSGPIKSHSTQSHPFNVNYWPAQPSDSPPLSAYDWLPAPSPPRTSFCGAPAPATQHMHQHASTTSSYSRCCGANSMLIASTGSSGMATPVPDSDEYDAYVTACGLAAGGFTSTCCGDSSFTSTCCGDSSFSSSPVLYGPSSMCQLPAAMPAQRSGCVTPPAQQQQCLVPFSDNDLEEIDSRLQQLLARKQMLMEQRAASATCPMSNAALPQLVSDQVMISQAGCSSGFMASSASCSSTRTCSTAATARMLEGVSMGGCSAEHLLLAAPATTATAPGYSFVPDMQLTQVQQQLACVPDSLCLATSSMSVPMAMGVDQLYCSHAAQDKLRELSQMQELEMALRGELLHLLPMA